MLQVKKETMVFWTPGCILSPTEAGTYKDFLFKGNSSTFLSSGIETLGKVLNIVKLVNGNVIHFLVKLLKDVNLLVSSIISFFFSKVIKRFCLIIEPLFFTKGQSFSAADCFISLI